MNQIFRFELAVRTGFIVTLLLAAVFAVGCPKKQEKSAQTPTSPVSNDTKSPKRDTQPKSPPAEANNAPSVVITPTEPAVNEKGTTPDKTPPKVADAKTAVQQKGKAPSPPQLKAPAMPEPEDLKPFESLKDAEEKIDFITDYADEHPESAAIVAYKALDDNDAEVRSAAMEMLATREIDDPNVVFVAAKAMKDSEPQIRQSAVEACTAVTDPAVGNLLVAALNDESEDVRAAAIQLADEKEPVIRLEVLKAGITSQYEDVRESAVSSLIDVSSPAAVDILIEGLKDPNPEFREPFKDALDFLLPAGDELQTYDQYKKWWNANRNKYDDELTEKD